MKDSFKEAVAAVVKQAAQPNLDARTNSQDVLRGIVDRIEALEAEKATIQEALKDVYEEARSEGYMVKVLRLVIRRRKRQGSEVRMEDELVATYEAQLES